MSQAISAAQCESSVLGQLTTDQQRRLCHILDDYLVTIEEGLPPSPSQLLQANPDLAAPLEAYLYHLQMLHRVAVDNASTESASEDGHQVAAQRRLGDYVIEHEIGRGGMGIVYEARQISLDRRVAVKILPYAAVIDKHKITRFNNEAQAAAQLQHPNIVPVYGIGVERGVHFYAMQLVDGQSLGPGDSAASIQPHNRPGHHARLVVPDGIRRGHCLGGPTDGDSLPAI